MSMSKYMHPRNIYKTPPNFKQLAIDYPDFRKYVKQELSGKVSLDFKDVAALRALSTTLLKKDFSLNVDMPLNKLIPTIPLRLNYILWVEDLINISGKTEKINGIDIGTGACCVYPLIISKKYGWSMLATEVDDESIKFANGNVDKNGLNDLIKVKKVSEDFLLKGVVSNDVSYDFCMCNPPFFSSQKETVFEFKSRKDTRPRPRNAFTATSNEVVVKGGEVDFITRLIHESKVLSERIRIFTTMIGHKTSLVPLKKVLREVEVISFKQTEFCQGNTTRWGLAWTFFDVDLRTVPEATVTAARKQKKKNPVQYILNSECNDLNIDDIGSKVLELLDALEIEHKLLKKSKNVIAYTATAHSNNWSHQRRKKRAAAAVANKSSSSNESASTNESTSTNEATLKQHSPNVDSTTDLISEMGIRSPGSAKREFEDDDEGYYNNKKRKLNDGEASMEVPKNFLEFTTLVRRDAKGTHFELLWIDGYASKETLNQILQYFKNNLKID